MKYKYFFFLSFILILSSCSPDKSAAEKAIDLPKPAPGIISIFASVEGIDKSQSKVSLKVLDSKSGGNTPSLTKGNIISVYFSDRGTIFERFKTAKNNQENITIKIKAVTLLGENNHQWQFIEFIK